MKTTPESTTTVIEELQKRCEQLERQNAELVSKLEWFEEQFRLSQARKFGASSEKTPPEQQQQLFNEAEAEAKSDQPEPTVKTITYRRRKQASQRLLTQFCSIFRSAVDSTDSAIPSEVDGLPSEVGQPT